MRQSLSILSALVLAGAALAADPPVRFIDAHTHLLTPGVSPDAELAMIKNAGEPATVIMNGYPETLRDLTKRYPGFVIPFIQFVRTPGTDGMRVGPNSVEELTKLLDSGAICGFGELGGTTSLLSMDMLNIYALADARHVPLNMHLQLDIPEVAASIAQVPGRYPGMSLILAHAGWNAGPEINEKLLHDNPNVYIDLSVRLDPAHEWRNPPGPGSDTVRSILTPDDALQPAWRALIERYPERFLFGMDISALGPKGRVNHAAELIDVARTALSPLPRGAQEAIAHGTLEKLVGGCPAWHPAR